MRIINYKNIHNTNHEITYIIKLMICVSFFSSMIATIYVEYMNTYTNSLNYMIWYYYIYTIDNLYLSIVCTILIFTKKKHLLIKKKHRHNTFLIIIKYIFIITQIMIFSIIFEYYIRYLIGNIYSLIFLHIICAGILSWYLINYLDKTQLSYLSY